MPSVLFDHVVLFPFSFVSYWKSSEKIYDLFLKVKGGNKLLTSVKLPISHFCSQGIHFVSSRKH